jgi:hypothetical protein
LPWVNVGVNGRASPFRVGGPYDVGR